MQHKIVIDLGLGDAGKGATVDRICSTEPVDTVVRFSGGPQAAHNVLTPDGRHHTFAQFGSGTFAGARTFLSRHMLVNPFTLMNEYQHLKELGEGDALERLQIDGDALLVTPIHAAANRAREAARGINPHGTTGHGIGETARVREETPELALQVKDLLKPLTLRAKLYQLDEHLAREIPNLEHLDIDAMVEDYKQIRPLLQIVDETALVQALYRGTCVFEGSQGVLLDRWHGFFPHVTRSDTTAVNAFDLLSDAGAEENAEVIGVIRSYHTRHGAGPLPTEVDPDSKFCRARPELHNTAESSMAGAFRVGHFDGVLFDYALRAAHGVDGLVVTHMDRADPNGTPVATRYYTQDGVVISRLLPKFDYSLERVERLGRLISGVNPGYDLVKDLPAYLSDVHGRLPIRMTGWGPRRDQMKGLFTRAAA